MLYSRPHSAPTNYESSKAKKSTSTNYEQSKAKKSTPTNYEQSKAKNLLKVFYGQEPSSGESTTTESGVNYQLLSVMH